MITWRNSSGTWRDHAFFNLMVKGGIVTLYCLNYCCSLCHHLVSGTTTLAPEVPDLCPRPWKWTKYWCQSSESFFFFFFFKSIVSLKWSREGKKMFKFGFCLEPTHQLSKQFHWGGGGSGSRRSAAVQPQAGHSKVSSVCFLVFLGTKAGVTTNTETEPDSVIQICFLVYLFTHL